MTTLPTMQSGGTRIAIEWGTQHTPREFASLEEFRDWNSRNSLVRIHTIQYWCTDVSGQVGMFRYNDVVARDNGWRWYMVVRNVPDPLHVFTVALAQREAHLNKLDDDAAAVTTWRPVRVRGVVAHEDVDTLALAA